ncbi:MAG: hypothetical protein HKN28_15600 [Alphaproteobacteria bacterium]|nr:hypothetical protein [Alphaproteobacteria bacterium]
MRAFTAVTGAFLVIAFTGSPGHADLRDDIASCRAIAEDGARLDCFDALDVNGAVDGTALNDATAAALQKEFRFDSGLMTGDFTFRLAVSGDLKISRATMAAREVENVARRINKALSGNSDWAVAVTVHGAEIALSRGNPYTGAELLAQAKTGLAGSGLAEDRYAITQGEDATPILWDDGRVRSVNEHIIVEVVARAALTR